MNKTFSKSRDGSAGISMSETEEKFEFRVNGYSIVKINYYLFHDGRGLIFQSTMR